MMLQQFQDGGQPPLPTAVIFNLEFQKVIIIQSWIEILA